MNLSVSDCLACLSYSFFHVDRKTFLIFQFFVRWGLVVLFVSITSISIDRFLMVAYPIKHCVLINGKVMVLWLATICMDSGLCHSRLDKVFREQYKDQGKRMPHFCCDHDHIIVSYLLVLYITS